MTSFDWFLATFAWYSIGHVVLCRDIARYIHMRNRDIARYIHMRNPDFVPDVTPKFIGAWLFVAFAWPYWIGRDR